MALTTEESRELEALRSLREDAETFEQFVGRVSPQFALVPPHLRPLYDLVQRTRYEQVFSCVSMPPRHGKTVSLALAVAWRVLYDPACLNFYTTYADDRATNFGRSVRRIVMELGVPFAAAAGNVDDWRTFAEGGLKSTSKGGQIMGEGAKGGLVVVDDILKGFLEARSKAERDKTFRYLTTDVMSRLEGGASMIVLNTRWDPDDPIGRIKKDPLGIVWEHINLPAIGDEHGNPVDERLYPEFARPLWLDVDEMHPGSADAAMAWYRRIRARGEYAWWALYQGVPRSETVGVFTRDPARYTPPFNWQGKRGCIAMDPAGTAKTSADFTAIGVLAMDGYGEDAECYLVEASKKQITVPAAARLALEWQRKYRLPLVIEAIGNAQAIPQLLRELAPGINITEITGRIGDKFLRAQPLASAWNRGKFMVPSGIDIHGSAVDVDWVDDICAVARAFTGSGKDAEDDVVDMMAHGYNYLATGTYNARLAARW